MKWPKCLAWSCSLGQVWQASGKRETGDKVTLCPLTSAAGSLVTSVFIENSPFPCPNYLQEEQGLLFRPLSSGTGCSFTLQEKEAGQREEPVTSEG